jgi:hypothetical protein
MVFPPHAQWNNNTVKQKIQSSIFPLWLLNDQLKNTPVTRMTPFLLLHNMQSCKLKRLSRPQIAISFPAEARLLPSGENATLIISNSSSEI